MKAMLHAAARRMILADVSSAAGYRQNNSLAGSVLAIQYQVPRWIAEDAVRGAVAGGLKLGGRRVSFLQMEYLQYVEANPGCCIADVDRACRQDRGAGHYWVYASVRRLVRRGLLCSEPGPGGRVILRLPSPDSSTGDAEDRSARQ